MQKKKRKIKKEDYKISLDKIKNSKYFIPIYNKNIKEKESKMSWFDITDIKYNIKHEEEELNETKCSPCIKSKQIRIFPNEEQEVILQNWIEYARIIYNITVHHIRCNRDLINFKKNKLNIGFIRLKPIIKGLYTTYFKDKIEEIAKAKVYKKDKTKSKPNSMPVHIQDQAINDVIKAYKTAFALRATGYIKHFIIRYKKRTKPHQTIYIEKKDFSEVIDGFYVSSLNEMKCIYPIRKQNIKHDTRLTYDKRTNKYTLHVPVDYSYNGDKAISNKCFIDGGLRTFMNIYSPNGATTKILNSNKTYRLTHLVNKKIKLKQLYDETKLMKYMRAFKRVGIKIDNYRKELHYKTALYLCKNYNEITLGKLSTKGIISKSNKLSVFNKFYSAAVSHDKFRTILKNKCNEYKRVLNIVLEHNTSKTCTNCGYIKEDLGCSKIFKCNNCNYIIDRDINAARNMAFKL
jgi:transposase